jgi:hypothetical protein
MGDSIIGSVKGGAVILRDEDGDGVVGGSDRAGVRDGGGRIDFEPSRVRAALRELGIGGIPTGVRVPSLSAYAQTVGKIDTAVPQDGTAGRSRLAANARACADAAGIPVDQDRLQGLIRGTTVRKRDDRSRPAPAVASLQEPKTKL